MTIFELLKSDHRKVESILKLIDKTTSEDAYKRTDLFSRFRKEFQAHAEAEEAAVYEALEGKKKTHDLALEGYEEHLLVAHLIEQLSDLSPSEEAWGAKMTVAKELIEHHLEEEEGDLFKKMRASFDKKELAAMADAFKRRKKEGPSAVPPVPPRGQTPQNEVRL